jgi:hypothetical protein
MPEQISLHISSILIWKANLSSRSTPKHLFETTDQTTLLFMIMLEYKSFVGQILFRSCDHKLSLRRMGLEFIYIYPICDIL